MASFHVAPEQSNKDLPEANQNNSCKIRILQEFKVLANSSKQFTALFDTSKF